MSAAAPNGETSAGAGGKFRRKPLRKSQATTPYDRPPAAIRNTSNGWLSKIVNPASNIISASAKKLFSFASRKQQLMPPPPPPAPRQDALVAEVNRTTDSVYNLTPRVLCQIALQCSIVITHVNSALLSGDSSGTDQHSKEPVSLENDGSNLGISELEKILAEKTFTESEINRLTALLNSQTVEVTGEKASEAWAQRTVFDQGNSSEFKSILVPDIGINSVRCLGATSSHVSNEDIEEDIATPAELAKAYMGSRPSNVSPSMFGSRSLATRNDLPLINRPVFPSSSRSIRTSVKTSPSTGVPENGYTTPHSRVRSALYSMARTPYSRSQKSSDIRSVHRYTFQPPQLALDADKVSSSRQMALKRRSNVLDDDIGSTGPIRRIRQKPSRLSSQISNEPAVGNLPMNGTGVMLSYRSKNAGSRSGGESFISVPSQSSAVAQKILQQLEKLSPSPKEKSSQRKSMHLAGMSSFTSTTGILSVQAVRNVGEVDSFKIIESSQENSKASDNAQKVATNKDKDSTLLEGLNLLEENGPQMPTSISKSNSENAFNSFVLVENKQGLQISDHEDNNLQTQSDPNGTVPNGSINIEKVGNMSYSSGSPSKTIQSTAADNISSSLFGKVLTNGQTTMTPLFGHGVKVADKLSPSAFTSSSPTADDSPSVKTSALPESSIGNLSVLSDPSKTKPGTCGSGDMDTKPSTASSGISMKSAVFSSGSLANNGFSNGSFPGQPASAASSSQPSGVGAPIISSFVSPASAANVPNAATGTTSSGVSLSSSPSVSQFSASPVFGDSSSRKDSHVSSIIDLSPSDIETSNTVTAANGITSSLFGGAGESSATANGSHVFSGFGSYTSSPKVDVQSIGSVSNPVSSKAKTVTTADESIPQNTLFQFGSAGISSAPTSGLYNATNFSPASATNSLTSPMFGKNSLASSEVAGNVGSTGGLTDGLFDSKWQSNSSLLFGSAASSSMVSPPVFQFGSSASSSAYTPSNSIPGSLFGSSSASAVSAVSFTSAATSSFPLPFSASQPVFAFGSSPSLPNSSANTNQRSLQDTMAADTIQTSAPATSMFGQPQPMPNSVFSFSSPSSSITTGIFQFGGQPSPAASLNQTPPFQASGSLNAGGGFSLGSGAGDKPGRKIIKVKRNPKRR